MRLEKPKQHRKGLWSPEEDEKLRNHVLRHGPGNWSLVPTEIGLQRNGKSCRLRWINYLCPGLKRGTFSENEEEKIFSLHRDLGNKWSQMAKQLPGRTDNEIKNHWHTHMKKRISKTAEAASMSTNVSSFSSLDYSSPKPVSNNGSFPHLSTYNMYSGLNNGISKEGLRGSMPKVIFEEWFSSSKLNPLDDQLTNFKGNAFMDDDDQLFSLDEGRLQLESGSCSCCWDLGVDHRPPGKFSNLGISSDRAICSSGFNQIYATVDVMYPWNVR